MTPDERRTLEATAERHLRRSELRDALALFRQLAQAFPDDEALSRRLAEVEENLQPAELTHARSAFRPEPAKASPTHQAEALASRGDFAGAITIYRSLLEQNPNAELVRERLAELFQLAQARSPSRVQPAPAPRDPKRELEKLLERITSRRRP
jgi:tetratricopeptide (TPR) repeat protein